MERTPTSLLPFPLDDPLLVPAGPGVYLFRGEGGEVLYVGKSARLRDRLLQYVRGEVEVRKESLLSKARHVELFLTHSEKEALLLESHFIQTHRPKYNVRLTDDKRYPFIHLTDDPFPRIVLVREIPKGGWTFGPFPDSTSARRVVELVREIFRIRNCPKLLPGGCLAFGMGLCLAPCITDPKERALKAPRSDPDLALLDPIREYPEAVRGALRLLGGSHEAISRKLLEEMEEASRNLEFEKAAQRRDKLRSLTSTLSRQSVFVRSNDDFDLFCVVREGGVAVGSVLFSRGGKVVGQEHFFFRSAPTLLPLEDLLEQFLQRYYESASQIPPRVVVDREFSSRKALEEVWGEKASVKVRIDVVSSKEEGLLDLARRNALYRLRMDRWRRGEEDHQRELEDLSRALSLGRPPLRIEAIDVSHLQGEDVVASVVVLVEGRPERSLYRRYRVRSVRNNDVEAIREVLLRRFRRALRESSPLPDLLLVDGGRPQLESALRALREVHVEVPVVALAKKEEVLYIPGRRDPLPLPLDSPALRLLVRGRDEAHRFALLSEQSLRRSRFPHSVLDSIPGIGPKRRKEIFAHFRSLRDMAGATRRELTEIPGIGPKLAERILEALRSEEPLRGTPPSGGDGGEGDLQRRA